MSHPDRCVFESSPKPMFAFLEFDLRGNDVRDVSIDRGNSNHVSTRIAHRGKAYSNVNQSTILVSSNGRDLARQLTVHDSPPLNRQFLHVGAHWMTNGDGFGINVVGIVLTCPSVAARRQNTGATSAYVSDMAGRR